MKIFLNLCCAASVACLLSFAASSSLGPAAPAEMNGGPDGSVARSSSSTITRNVFSPHARSKVVQYFDTYRTDPLGLPPGCAAKIQSSEITPLWKNVGIDPGGMVQQSERSSLIEVPSELAKVLPANPSDSLRYYLAGSNLVAVTPSFRILDSVRIPTVRFPSDNGHARPQWVRHVQVRGDQ